MQIKTVPTIRDLGAHNTKELLVILDDFQQQGIEIVSEKERSIFEILQAAEELDREYRSQRQKAVVEKAKQAGRMKGSKSTINNNLFATMYAAYKRKEITQVDMARQLGRSKVTICRAVRRFEETGHV